jgi:hypothetical protein
MGHVMGRVMAISAGQISAPLEMLPNGPGSGVLAGLHA